MNPRSRSKDEIQADEDRARLDRRVLQMLAHCIFVVWQKRRVASLLERASKARQTRFDVRRLADMLGWDSHRAREAAHDLGDVRDAHDRLYPKLRSLSELAGIDVLEVELCEDAGEMKLGAFYGAVVEHLAGTSPGRVKRELRAALAGCGEEELGALAAFLSEHRKDPDIKALGDARMEPLLRAALRAAHEIATREYDRAAARDPEEKT